MQISESYQSANVISDSRSSAYSSSYESTEPELRINLVLDKFELSHFTYRFKYHPTIRIPDDNIGCA